MVRCRQRRGCRRIHQRTMSLPCAVNLRKGCLPGRGLSGKAFAARFAVSPFLPAGSLNTVPPASTTEALRGTPLCFPFRKQSPQGGVSKADGETTPQSACPADSSPDKGEPCGNCAKNGVAASGTVFNSVCHLTQQARLRHWRGLRNTDAGPRAMIMRSPLLPRPPAGGEASERHAERHTPCMRRLLYSVDFNTAYLKKQVRPRRTFVHIYGKRKNHNI